MHASKVGHTNLYVRDVGFTIKGTCGCQSRSRLSVHFDPYTAVPAPPLVALQ